MTSPRHTYIRTQDGTAIVCCLNTGVSASGRTVADAHAELRHLLAHAHAHADARRAGRTREGATA